MISNKIFIVHGRDNEMKLDVARVLEKLGLTPVILQEQPNRGRTIIEKFSEYTNVNFAIILLSPDDKGFLAEEAPKNSKPRARQNVILELGFFLGRLGRERVFVLYRDTERFEPPSDYLGILFTIYDERGAWKFGLIRKLQAIGYKVDANRLIG